MLDGMADGYSGRLLPVYLVVVAMVVKVQRCWTLEESKAKEEKKRRKRED